MDAQSHLNDLAQRYAKALVAYHSVKGRCASDEFATICDLQDTMNEVAQEVAAETGC